MGRLAVLVGAFLLVPSALGADTAPQIATTTTAVKPELAPPDLEPPAIDDAPETIVPGEHVRLDTASGPVHVWWPEGYDAATAVTIVYVHGYWVDVDDAWLQHGLPEQFGAAAVNALFIAPESPVTKSDNVSWPSLTRLLETVGHELPIPSGPVIALGHSGAFRTLAEWVKDPRLDTLVMFDSGYGSMIPFRDWARASPKHRMITVGDDTREWTSYLNHWLGTKLTLDITDVVTDPTVRAKIAKERLVHIKSSIGHMTLVTGASALPSLLRLLAAPLPSE